MISVKCEPFEFVVYENFEHIDVDGEYDAEHELVKAMEKTLKENKLMLIGEPVFSSSVFLNNDVNLNRNVFMKAFFINFKACKKGE